MNLFEHEGKALLARAGIAIPRGFVLRPSDGTDLSAALGDADCVAKAQVLASGRAGLGGIALGVAVPEAYARAQAWFKDGLDGLAVDAALIEESFTCVRELYLACVHDASSRGPIMLFTKDGGTGVEASRGVDRFALDPRDMTRLPDDLTARLEAAAPGLSRLAADLTRAFEASDATQIEINPLGVLADGSFVALDAKVALDDAAAFRHPEWVSYPDRAATSRETSARAIDEGGRLYQGNAGTYIEMGGDVAVLLSGGGASMVLMDELALLGLAAANYTEYSGNPAREKVRALARVVLSKPGLRGLLIAGGIANFTDIKETFAGIAEALDEVRPSCPIVVRRAGPNDREGLESLRACAKRNGLRMALHGKETTLSASVEALSAMMASYEHPA